MKGHGQNGDHSAQNCDSVGLLLDQVLGVPQFHELLAGRPNVGRDFLRILKAFRGVELDSLKVPQHNADHFALGNLAVGVKCK